MIVGRNQDGGILLCSDLYKVRRSEEEEKVGVIVTGIGRAGKAGIDNGQCGKWKRKRTAKTEKVWRGCGVEQRERERERAPFDQQFLHTPYSVYLE